jgi:hypothetical protein
LTPTIKKKKTKTKERKKEMWKILAICGERDVLVRLFLAVTNA